MHLVITAIAAPEPRGDLLACPVCDDPRTMPVAVLCSSLPGQRGEARIDRDGIHVDPAAPSVDGGSIIAITCRCRRGHRFSLRLRTSAQATTIESVALPTQVRVQDPERN